MFIDDLFLSSTKVQPSEKRKIKLQLHVTNEEYDSIQSQFRDSGMRYLSDYLRAHVLDKKRSSININKKELLRQLDQIGFQISRIGANINQIANMPTFRTNRARLIKAP
jgi:hypothetical protein